MKRAFILIVALVLIGCVPASPPSVTPAPPPPHPTPTPLPSPSPGFLRQEFKDFYLEFPPNWKLEVVEGGARIWLSSGLYMVTITESSGGKSPEELIEWIGAQYWQWPSQREEEVTIWGKRGPALLVDFKDEVGKFIVVAHKGRHYVIMLAGPSFPQLDAIPITMKWK